MTYCFADQSSCVFGFTNSNNVSETVSECKWHLKNTVKTSPFSDNTQFKTKT